MYDRNHNDPKDRHGEWTILRRAAKVMVVIVLILLVIAAMYLWFPTAAFGQSSIPPEYDISALRPATEAYVKIQSAFPSVPFATTFAHRSTYRADWTGQSIMKIYAGYVYCSGPNDCDVRLLGIDPPPVLSDCRSFQPDPTFVNIDRSVPDWDPCFYGYYRRWLTRPEASLKQQIVSSRLNVLIWMNALKNVNMDNHAVQEALEKMGLEENGFPPDFYPGEATAGEQAALEAVLRDQVAQYQSEGVVISEAIPTELETIDANGTPITVQFSELDMVYRNEPRSILSIIKLAITSLIIIIFVLAVIRSRTQERMYA